MIAPLLLGFTFTRIFGTELALIFCTTFTQKFKNAGPIDLALPDRGEIGCLLYKPSLWLWGLRLGIYAST